MTDKRFLQDGLFHTSAHLIEECGELIAALGKSWRWGFDSVNPLLPPEQQEANLAWVRREMADVREMLDRFDAELNKAHGGPP